MLMHTPKKLQETILLTAGYSVHAAIPLTEDGRAWASINPQNANLPATIHRMWYV